MTDRHDYIAGHLADVEHEIHSAGFEVVGAGRFRKGNRRISYVPAPDHLRGLNGHGRKMILCCGAPQGMRVMALSRGFEVVYGIELDTP